MKLARERAIARAYLLAGDEDLREGVVEAKELGVQAVLLGMPIEDGQNQSARLVRECDECVALASETWKQHFARRDPDAQPDEGDVAAARGLGEAFARRWQRRTPRGGCERCSRGFPPCPSCSMWNSSCSRRAKWARCASDPIKQELRASFWFALKRIVPGRKTGRDAPPADED
jgi:hypothetical protein